MGFIAMTSGFLTGFGFAQEGETVPVLPEVVVTGTRWEEEIRKIPANVTVITPEKIATTNARTVADVLRSEEGIVVRDLLGNGKTAQVDLRGFGETGPFNTLVLVDGRRVNEIDLSGVDWTQIPLDQIERVEIVRGTGSVLYGDNAVGGVINIITKTPTGRWSGSAGGNAGSYQTWGGQATVSGGYERVAGSLSASYDSTDGYRDNGELRTRDFGGKVIYDVSDILSFNVSGSFHRDDFGLPGPLSEEELERDRQSTNFPLDNGETTDWYTNLRMDLDLGRSGEILADLSYRDRNNQDEFVVYSSASDRDLITWTFTPRYIWSEPIAGRKNKLIAGIDIYRSDLDADFFFGSPLALSGFSDIQRDSYGFYASDDLSLSENLILSVGARHERVRYDLRQEAFLSGLAPLDETVRDQENAYSMGLTLLYNEKSSAFARLNRSFRFPLTDELVVFDFFDTGSIRVNPDIKPQTGIHYEVGIRHFLTPDIQLNCTLYRAEITNEIFFNLITYTNENYPDTLHQGVELGAKADLFKKLRVFGNYTYEEATFGKGPFQANDLPAVPRNKGNLGFQIYDVYPDLAFSAYYSYVGSSYLISDQANAFEKLDAYYTIDARLTYQWNGLRAFVGVNNLTDQEYSEYGVLGGFPSTPFFYSAPERNWVAGVEAVF
jgi:iron complex outermembrane receptor protein